MFKLGMTFGFMLREHAKYSFIGLFCHSFPVRFVKHALEIFGFFYRAQSITVEFVG